MGDMADDQIEDGLDAIFNHGNYQCDVGCPICNPNQENPFVNEELPKPPRRRK